MTGGHPSEPYRRPRGAAAREFIKAKGTRCRPGTLSLYFNKEKVGEGRIKTQPRKFSLTGEGLNVGQDRGEAVSSGYPGKAPWAFTGGTIHRVVVNVSGAPWVDREREVRAAFALD